MTQHSTSRVLSIQSHVTSGYVGNRAAVFPLQLLGYDVDILNSCMLSNHTGYENGAPGIRLTGEDLSSVIEGMKKNQLFNDISHVLTGYIGTASFLSVVVETIKCLRAQKKHNEKVIFVCDPVLGDNGKLYVPEELVQVYKDSVIKHATILTPNAYELGLLTGLTITSEKDAFNACNMLHEQYKIETVIVTGTRLKHFQTHHVNNDKVSVLVSSKSKDTYTRFAVDADHLKGHFTGTGDLISALILAWTDKISGDLQKACANAMASVSGVLLKTTKLPKSKGACPFYELRLIQSQQELLHPPLQLVQLRNVDSDT